ncbi:MAG: outer membrane protein assembly factor BamC [Succinivibrio sp.]
MSFYKKGRIAIALGSALLPAVFLNGCVTVSNYYQEYFGLDTSTEEPTGYYEHTDAKIYRNTIVVPEGLKNPGTNPELKIPSVDPNKLSGPVGRDVDVRAPTAPYRSEDGLRTEWAEGEAIVWFDKNGTHGITTEDDAWMLLASVLKHMNVAVGRIAEGQYVLTTIARDFNEYGKPYDASDEEAGMIRYTQIYQLRVGHNAEGELGIATKLIGSMTSLSNGHKMKDTLNLIEQERFAMGFSNFIVHEIGNRNQMQILDPENLVVTLGRDDNRHDAILVEAPFETTVNLLNNIFPKIGWKVTSHSVAKAEYDIEVLDSSDDLFLANGASALDIRKGTYKIRVGIHGNASSITIYDSKDAPVKYEVIARLYQGFADKLEEEFRSYSGANVNVVKAK